MKAIKRIFAIILSMLILAGTMVTAFALPPAPTDEFGNPLPHTPLQMIEITPSDGNGKYEKYFVEYLNSQYENENFKYYYEEIYESYPAVGNPSTPDYVLVECYKDYIYSEGDYSEKFENYEIKGYYRHCPYELGYFIFVPETERIYTLREAVNAGIKCYDGIEKISHNPIEEIYDYGEFPPLHIPGGGTTNPPTIKLLGSEKGAEIYEVVLSSKENKTTHTIGDWEITGNDYGDLPYSYDIFVYHKSEVYELDEALEKGIVTDIFCVNQSANTKVENKTLNNKCKYAYLNHLNYIPTEKDTVYCKALNTIRNNTVFTAYIETEGQAYPDIPPRQQIIGNYIFTAPNACSPEDNPIGLYVLTGNRQVVSALTAYKSGLVSDEELAKLAGGVPYNKYDPNGTYDYEDVIIPLVEKEYIHEEFAEITSYREIYKHYQHMGPDMPDYVLISLYTNLGYDMPVADLFGDKLLYSSSGSIPFAHGYGIYIPETQKLYSLSVAVENEIEGIEIALEHISFDALMGDNDEDRKLTIKDATYLQKCLAGLKEYRKDDVIEAFQYDDNAPARFISDYNRDGVRNIRDATAIQKKLAKITE